MSEISAIAAPAASMRVNVDVVERGSTAVEDLVTVEEPLEIRLVYRAAGVETEQSVSVTMRTPGNDLELAVGFLLGEGIIRNRADIAAVEHCGPPSPDKGIRNVVKVELADTATFEVDKLLRHFFTTSSCGVCGKASLDAVRVTIPGHEPSTFRVQADVLKRLPERLREAQLEFDRTGGLHASATFTRDGTLERTREDVGRHNALDKLIGSYVETGVATLRDRGLLLSGRASFELVQKAAVAGIPLIAAIGPPSSLAIELAEDQSMTLIGFLKSDRFNVYAGNGVSV